MKPAVVGRNCSLLGAAARVGASSLCCIKTMMFCWQFLYFLCASLEAQIIIASMRGELSGCEVLCWSGALPHTPRFAPTLKKRELIMGKDEFADEPIMEGGDGDEVYLSFCTFWFRKSHFIVSLELSLLGVLQLVGPLWFFHWFLYI